MANNTRKAKAPKGSYTQVSKDDLVAALQANFGNITRTARALGVVRQTVYNLIEKYELQAVTEEARLFIVDLAEDSLIELLAERNPAATMFVLKTAGRALGYGEQVQVDSGVVVEVIYGGLERY